MRGKAAGRGLAGVVAKGPLDPRRSGGSFPGMSLAELENEVQKLPPAELAAFMRWFEEFASDQWDRQFERDAVAGKLDKLGRKADAVFEAGECTEL